MNIFRPLMCPQCFIKLEKNTFTVTLYNKKVLVKNYKCKSFHIDFTMYKSQICILVVANKINNNYYQYCWTPDNEWCGKTLSHLNGVKVNRLKLDKNITINFNNLIYKLQKLKKLNCFE